MSELNINDLPSEIMITIFQFLDAANLMNSTLTCKLWKNLIESSCRWSLNLEPVRIFRNNAEQRQRVAEQRMNFVLATHRKFKRIEIVIGRLNESSQTLEIFRKHGFYVVELQLYRVQIDSISTFAELLNLTPNLKHVDVRSNHIHDKGDLPDHVQPDLKKLRNLEICYTSCGIIQCFRKSKLTAMTIYDLEEDSGHRFTHFILSQDMLTSLIAQSHGDSTSILAEIGALDVPIPFRLTKLAILDVPYRNSQFNHNLLKFVKSQTNSLTEMEIGNGIPSSVYECVFASMTKLNSLGVATNYALRDSGFNEPLQENRSVCTMKILDCGVPSSDDIQYFGNFFKNLPNIRNLFLSNDGCDCKNILAVAAQNLGKLEFLHMAFIGERLIDDIGRVNFCNLSTLYIGHLLVRIDWNEFTKIHSRLVVLTIQGMKMKSFLTSDDIDQMTTNVDLQSIKLGAGFVADGRFFEIIRIKCPNLKVLDLHKSCISHEFDYSNENNLLRLCDVIDWSTYSQML